MLSGRIKFSAILAHIVSRRQYNEWVRFTVNVPKVYKSDRININRGEQHYLWVSTADLACKCPKIRIGRKYLVVTHGNKQNDRHGLILDRKSIVIRMRRMLNTRLRKWRSRDNKRCWEVPFLKEWRLEVFLKASLKRFTEVEKCRKKDIWGMISKIYVLFLPRETAVQRWCNSCCSEKISTNTELMLRSRIEIRK